MGIFSRKKPVKQAGRSYAPNPHRHSGVRSAGFFSTDAGRLLSGWDQQSSTIDYYLQAELRQLRARSREMVRRNPYGKRFVTTMKTNIVGPTGINIQAQSIRNREPDQTANDALEAAFKDWGNLHCDYQGRVSWVEMQNTAIANAAQDGEFIFEVFEGKQHGKYGFQLRSIDPELLDVSKNTKTRNGEIRLGVEYDNQDRVTRYHFRRRTQNAAGVGAYYGGEEYQIDARRIIHGFIPEWPDQSRGVPWMHASIERAKHLEKYDEAAIVKARSTAATMAVLRSTPGNEYTGEEDGEGEYSDATLDQYEAGTIKDIGTREITQLDSDYPHQMYDVFVKSQLRSISAGLGISYHTLSSDLEGVNYSSIRAGVLEDREIFKGLQNWFIRQFIRPVYERWVGMAYLQGAIMIGGRWPAKPPAAYMPAHYQGRRWAWVDPQKDGNANQQAIESRLKSLSQIMREQGDDPDSVWLEIKRDNEKMAALGIAPISVMVEVTDDDD